VTGATFSIFLPPLCASPLMMKVLRRAIRFNHLDAYFSEQLADAPMGDLQVGSERRPTA
jgi:hypothetical protein